MMVCSPAADMLVEGSTHVPRQPRTVGQTIVPGHHIKSLSIAKDLPVQNFYIEPTTSSASASPESSIEPKPKNTEQLDDNCTDTCT